MHARIAIAAILTALLVAPAGEAAPFPPQPDYCASQFHPGPTWVSCPFEYGGRRVTVFGVAFAPAGAAITIEIYRGSGINEQVLFSCSAAADGAGPVSLPTSSCAQRSTVLPVADGTVLRCRHRGPGSGVFGCLSP